MGKIIERCGNPDKSRPAWLIPAPKDQLPKPVREAFPRRSLPPPAMGVVAGGGSPAIIAPSLNRIKVAAAARGQVRNSIAAIGGIGGSAISGAGNVFVFVS